MLQVIPSIARAHGGPSEAIRTIEQALAGEGIDSRTCTTDDDGPGRAVDKPHGQLLEEEGAQRLYFAKNTEFYKCSWPFFSWAMRHVHEYDVVHIHALFSFTSTAAAWAARRAGVPYVLRPLGTLSPYGLRARRPLLKRLSMKLVEGGVIRHSAAVHVTSVAEQHEVEALAYAVETVVVPLAVRVSEAPVGDALANYFPHLAGARIVLFMSRLDPKKNVEGLLHAMRTISARHADAHLLIAGGGEADYTAGLRLLAGKLGIAERVTWAGHVEGAAKQVLLRDAWVFALPSYSENFGIAVAEALSAGQPCVVGHEVALAPQIEAAGAGQAVGTAAPDIAEALDRILAQPDLRARMAASARRLAQQEFSVPAMGKRLRAMYEHVIAKARARSLRASGVAR